MRLVEKKRPGRGLGQKSGVLWLDQGGGATWGWGVLGDIRGGFRYVLRRKPRTTLN